MCAGREPKQRWSNDAERAESGESRASTGQKEDIRTQQVGAEDGGEIRTREPAGSNSERGRSFRRKERREGGREGGREDAADDDGDDEGDEDDEKRTTRRRIRRTGWRKKRKTTLAKTTMLMMMMTLAMRVKQTERRRVLRAARQRANGRDGIRSSRRSLPAATESKLPWRSWKLE